MTAVQPNPRRGLPERRRAPERALAWLYTGPLGHLYGVPVQSIEIAVPRVKHQPTINRVAFRVLLVDGPLDVFEQSIRVTLNRVEALVHASHVARLEFGIKDTHPAHPCLSH